MQRGLSEKQYRAIELLIEGKPQTEIAEEVGVHRHTIRNWIRNDQFHAEYMAEIKRRTHKRLPQLFDSIFDGAIDGKSAAMAKLALQANGLLTDKLEVETKKDHEGVDIDAIRARLMQKDD